MAYRFSIRKHLKFGFLRPQWGVRGSLFAAFAVIAGMAIIISVGAGLVLGQLGKAMVEKGHPDFNRRRHTHFISVIQIQACHKDLRI